MRKRYFDDYGFLEWLDPNDYYSGNWSYICSVVTEDVEDGDDSGEYDLVRNGVTMEMRYTVVQVGFVD